jgi:DNA-directed RNA polymerase sigma subunit (sigma70/sigma32)
MNIASRSWDYYHQLGEQVSKRLDHQMSFSQIAREIGMSKQGVRQITMIALGKLAHQMRERYKD